MSYEHHVFISYVRDDNLWTPWVKQEFARRLNSYLLIEVGHLQKNIPLVFIDDQIQSGARWEKVLKRKVAHSTIMVCLFSAEYFQSEWCRREMALMLEREKHCGMEGCDENYGLIIPVRLGDGDTFPELATTVQFFDFEEFAGLFYSQGAPGDAEFSKKIKHLAKTVATTLNQVHAYNPDWQELTGDTHFDALQHKPLPLKPPRIPA